jgi:dTDP-4-dehydrorhamnose reductase
VKTVLLGGGGQLATDLERALADAPVTALPHSELDICDFEQVRRVLGDERPDVVINTAAFHHVDNCEDEWEKAFHVNAFACKNLASVCADLGATLVHISTDYVFSGKQSTPYVESDLPDPLSAYGASKVAGEFFIKTYCPSHIIVRSSGLYGVAGASGKGGNFVETMIRLAKARKPLSVVDDQIMVPTYTHDLAGKLVEVVRAGGRGIFHITHEGSCSWHEYAAQVFEYAGLQPELSPTTTEAYGAKAARPAYSVMNSEKLGPLGLEPLPPWSDALRRYLAQKGHLAD